MEIKYLIEIKDIIPVCYYSGYRVIDREIERFFDANHMFTTDVQSAKKYLSRKLAEGILDKLPMKDILVVEEHGFGD